MHYFHTPLQSLPRKRSLSLCTFICRNIREPIHSRKNTGTAQDLKQRHQRNSALVYKRRLKAFHPSISIIRLCFRAVQPGKRFTTEIIKLESITIQTISIILQGMMDRNHSTCIHHTHTHTHFYSGFEEYWWFMSDCFQFPLILHWRNWTFYCNDPEKKQTTCSYDTVIKI